MRHRGQRFGFGRTGLVGGATVAIVVALLVGPASGRAPAQDQPVVDDGRGLAGATVLSIAPTTGGLELAVTSGQARAETTGGLAQALARSFSLGLIGSSISAEGCDGSDPLVEAALLPQALRIDNRNGPGEASSTEIPVVAPILGVGTERVSADATPSARASTVTGDADISALLTLGGGRSYASSTVLPGDGREAEAGASIDVEIAGVIELTGMRWTARHRTGDNPSAEATFTLGGLSIAGATIPLELPLESLEPIGALINAALAPLGFTIELPTVERITEPVDVVRITPLKLLIADTPASPAVQAALDLTRDFRSQLFDALVAADCSIGSTLLVGDVVTGVASGTGALVLALGGAEATSGDIVEEDLFGDPGAPVDVGTPVVGSPGAPLPASPLVTPARAAGGSVERGP
ncbi:MAG: hypothetical protein M3Z03_05035, partial [Actinomycetota bacterium]|nr:hypothetical protein [Actinomycetota bacterium]